MTDIPDMKKLHDLLDIVDEEFQVGLAGQAISLKLTQGYPSSRCREKIRIAFKALAESGGHITEGNVQQIVPTIYHADRATTIILLPQYLRALLSLACKHADDAKFVGIVGESMNAISHHFGETLHGVNREDVRYGRGKPSVEIRMSNAEIYKRYMTRDMRRALKAYLIAWFDYFTHTYAAKLDLRRQWFHNSWL